MQIRGGHLMQEVVAYEDRLTGVIREEIPTHLKFIACNFQVTICLVPCCHSKLLVYPENLVIHTGNTEMRLCDGCVKQVQNNEVFKNAIQKVAVVAYERWSHMRVRLYCVFTEKIGVSFLISAILNGQFIIMFVHLYISQLILNMYYFSVTKVLHSIRIIST